jgi:hypothetical protein
LSEIRAKRALKNPKKRKIKDEDEIEAIDLTRPKKRIKTEDSRPVFIPKVEAEVKGELIDLTQLRRIKSEPVFIHGEVIDLT